jgi:hypothetical protein
MKMLVRKYTYSTSINLYFSAESESWLFTGILPNLYHPPETLGLRSETAGSLLVSRLNYFIEINQ